MKQKQKGDKDQKDIAWEIEELHNLNKQKYKGIKKGFGKKLGSDPKKLKKGQDHCTLDWYRLRRCIATINRWTDYCNNREIIIVIIGCLKKIAK